jgi:hypothetical protein
LLFFVHLKRPFLKPLASLSCGGSCSFPSPMPAERWRNPPSQLQARPNRESESKPESDRARAPESESKAGSDLLWTREPEAKGEYDLLWARESESKGGGPIFFNPRARVQSRGSPISVGPKSPMGPRRARSRTNRALCTS